MSSNCRSKRAEDGFTLIEVTVAITVLVIVLVLSLTLLFAMKSFAQRQQSFAEPRQTARRALDYLSYCVRGASDMNMSDATSPMPNAIICYYSLNGVPKQATYNNVTDSNLADLGTDIITLAKPAPGGMAIKIVGWTGSASATSISALFTQGCGSSNDNATNLAQFKQLMGYDTTSSASSLFLIYDPAGFWQYYQITSPTCTCSNASLTIPNVISMTGAPGGVSSLNLNPPGYISPRDLTCGGGEPCYMTAGEQFLTFRVRTVNGTPRLEQLVLPNRLFDSAQDNPGNAFTPLLDGIEDLQIAYIYGDGTVWNTSQRELVSSGQSDPDGVPNQQIQSATPKTYDAVNVRGLRISVVARSTQSLPTSLGGPPAAASAIASPEDSTVAYPQGFYHYRLTATVMIQNRILGN
jgi:prepilin-type N-terminal cleavage/methylation domain-containing protein